MRISNTEVLWLWTFVSLMCVWSGPRICSASYDGTWNDISVNNVNSSMVNRKGKFLFDTIFGLDTTVSDDDDEEVAAANDVKNCNCGTYNNIILYLSRK